MKILKINGTRLLGSIALLLIAELAFAVNGTTTILERLGRAETTPEWTYGGQAMWKVKDNVIFMSSLEISDNRRPDMCMKAASLQARAEMRRFILENISSSELLSQSDLMSNSEFQSVTTSLAHGKIKGASVKSRYWERFQTTDIRGEGKIRMRCASQISVAKKDLDTQLNKTIEASLTNNPRIKRALINAYNDFIGDLS